MSRVDKLFDNIGIYDFFCLLFVGIYELVGLIIFSHFDLVPFSYSINNILHYIRVYNFLNGSASIIILISFLILSYFIGMISNEIGEFIVKILIFNLIGIDDPIYSMPNLERNFCFIFRKEHIKLKHKELSTSFFMEIEYAALTDILNKENKIKINEMEANIKKEFLLLDLKLDEKQEKEYVDEIFKNRYNIFLFNYCTSYLSLNGINKFTKKMQTYSAIFRSLMAYFIVIELSVIISLLTGNFDYSKRVAIIIILIATFLIRLFLTASLRYRKLLVSSTVRTCYYHKLYNREGQP